MGLPAALASLSPPSPLPTRAAAHGAHGARRPWCPPPMVPAAHGGHGAHRPWCPPPMVAPTSGCAAPAGRWRSRTLEAEESFKLRHGEVRSTRPYRGTLPWYGKLSGRPSATPRISRSREAPWRLRSENPLYHGTVSWYCIMVWKPHGGFDQRPPLPPARFGALGDAGVSPLRGRCAPVGVP